MADASPRMRKPRVWKSLGSSARRHTLGGSDSSVQDRGIGGGAVTAASAVCQSCGAAPREGARFCDACGAALVASGEAAEYKQVTVLFADVVRSMDIAAALDMERLREVMTELLESS